MNRTVKKVLSLLLSAALLAALFAGCSSASTGSAASGETGDRLAQVKARGEMIIATEGTWAPWTYHDENDQLVGFDIDVAKAVCEKLGVKATFVEGEWDGLLAGTDTGMYDTMANGVNITDERKDKFDFSVPYAYSRTAIMVRSDDDRIASFEDLNGMTTANTVGSTYAQVAERYGANVTAVDDLNQTIELLLQGRIDATLNDEVTYIDYISQHPDANIKVAAYSEEADSIALPFRKTEDTATLRAEVDKILEELRQDGTLGEISTRYFGSDLSGK